ncbi:MAG TPA: MBL fold metallo-hydrolase, partial [Polyangia bacterium]|nr:MBL fold metallo-hydrolase [Polyangia bacterium]
DSNERETVMLMKRALARRSAAFLTTAALVVASCASTPPPAAPPLTQQRPLGALMTAAAYPNADTQLLLVTMAQLMASHREREGYDYFGRLAREQPARAALFGSLQATMQARLANEVPLIHRIAWVDDAIAKLDAGAAADPLLGRFARGLVFADLPARFGKARAAVADLEACLSAHERLPFDFDRGIYRALAAAYRTLGDARRSADMLARSGLGAIDDDATPRVLADVSVDAARGFRFSAPRLVREADGVYVAEGYDFANLAFIVTPAFVVAIDAGTTEETAGAAVSALRRITRAPIKYVILTHGHWDHVGGLAAVREPGSIVIARAGFAEELARSRSYPPPFQYFFGSGTMKLDVEPDKLVSAPESLTDGGLDLVLMPAKSGETADALFVQDRRHDLLFVGDAFMPYLGAPFVAEGSAEGYLGAIDQVLALHPRRLIHGHPPLTALFTIETMPGLRDALGALYARGVDAARAARPLAELLHDDFLPDSLRAAPAAVQPYLVVRDTFLQRLYSEHAGYWQANGDGIDTFTRPEWAAALDVMGGGGEDAFVRAARELETRGDAGLALQIAELGLVRHPTSAQLHASRERALKTLREVYAQTNPFRFIVYSEMAGHGLAPVQVPEATGASAQK